MLETIQTNQTDGELKKILKWLLLVAGIGGFVIFLFIPIHEPLPAEAELDKPLMQAEQRWQNQPVTHYELQITQVNSSINGTLRVEVQDEKIVKVLEEMKIGKTLTPAMPLNKTNATVSYIFSLVHKRHKFYGQEAAGTFCKTGVNIPTVTYDPKFGYPNNINSRFVETVSIAEKNLVQCSLDSGDFSGVNYSNQLLIKLVPLD